MNKTSTVRARIEPELKSDVDEILTQLGVTASEIIQLLYRQIQLRRGLPFDVRIPNELTARTLRSSRKLRNLKRFEKADDLWADLGL